MRIRQLPSKGHSDQSQASHDRLRETRLAYRDAEKLLRVMRKAGMDCVEQEAETARLREEYFAADRAV